MVLVVSFVVASAERLVVKQQNTTTQRKQIFLAVAETE